MLGGVNAGSVLSFWKLYRDTNEEGESGNYADSWMRARRFPLGEIICQRKFVRAS